MGFERPLAFDVYIKNSLVMLSKYGMEDLAFLVPSRLMIAQELLYFGIRDIEVSATLSRFLCGHFEYKGISTYIQEVVTKPKCCHLDVVIDLDINE